VTMDKNHMMEKGFKRLTHWDTEQVCWKQVLVNGMTRQTHQGTEQACWQWGILPGEWMFLTNYHNYPTRVLNRLDGSGLWLRNVSSILVWLKKSLFSSKRLTLQAKLIVNIYEIQLQINKQR
jgi:hypothetical protein